MANTLGGINLAQIAEESLLSLEAEMFILSAFHTDFSSEIRTKGESVTTRVPSSVTAVDVSGGYTAGNLTSTAHTISLNKEFGFPMAFTDAEVSKAGDIEFLRRIFIRPAIRAVLRKMVLDSLSQVTNANFTTNTVITSANFTYANAVGLDVALDNANAMSDRSLLITPTYAGTLRKDATIASALQGGNPELIAQGRLGMIAGFNTFTYTNIPANSENLAGIAMAPQGLLIAARQPAVANAPHIEVLNVNEESTGLPLQFRRWYEATEKKTYITVEAFYGVNVGVAGNVHRILSS